MAVPHRLFSWFSPAGILEQSAAKKFIRIKRAVEVRDGDKWARFEPFDGFKVKFTIDFDHPLFRDDLQTLKSTFQQHRLFGKSAAPVLLALPAISKRSESVIWR